MNRPPPSERAVPCEPRIADADADADADVERALADVCAPAVRAELAGLVHQDLGRPRLLTVAGLLAGMQICADRHRGQVLLDRTTAILHWAISPTMRERFGIPERPDDARGFEAGYAVVRRLFHRLIDAMDPSPLPKNHRLDKTTARRLQAAADPDALQQHAALLLLTGNAVVDASLTLLRPHLDAHWDGSTAIDATPVRTYSRGLRTTGPDASWYVREGDHRDTVTPPPSPPRTRRRTASGNAPPPRRCSATTPPSRSPATPTATERPAPTAPPTPASRPPWSPASLWTSPAMPPAPTPSGSWRTSAAAATRPASSPATAPTTTRPPTTSSSPPAPSATGSSSTTAKTSSASRPEPPEPSSSKAPGTAPPSRQPWSPPPATSTTRPSTRRHGPVASPPAPRSSLSPNSTPTARATSACPALPPPDASSARSSPPASAATPACRWPTRSRVPPDRPGSAHSSPSPSRLNQEPSTIRALPYGGEEWQRVYFRLRNSVEGFNGFAKDPIYEAIEQPGTRRVRGIAAQTILLAFQLAHANRRKIDRWLATIPPDGHPPHRRPTRRRPTRPLGSWTPTGHLTPE